MCSCVLRKGSKGVCIPLWVSTSEPNEPQWAEGDLLYLPEAWVPETPGAYRGWVKNHGPGAK